MLCFIDVFLQVQLVVLCRGRQDKPHKVKSLEYVGCAKLLVYYYGFIFFFLVFVFEDKIFFRLRVVKNLNSEKITRFVYCVLFSLKHICSYRLMSKKNNFYRLNGKVLINSWLCESKMCKSVQQKWKFEIGGRRQF
eukprot:TRINITY_DN7953_c0_g1_i1.p2 TRINITY_DN7953_c0_g1~~TRINITY_DN7953_c0_g1_i1.p2  ORF type:complete len:136 (+),score=0.86 TRINITY_DN7953_c0_g1_i1:371-778(+)